MSLTADGKKDVRVMQWLPDDTEPLADGDWVVWPLHDERVEPSE